MNLSAIFKFGWLFSLESLVEIVLTEQTFEYVVSFGVNLLVMTSHGLSANFNLFFLLVVQPLGQFDLIISRLRIPGGKFLVGVALFLRAGDSDVFEKCIDFGILIVLSIVLPIGCTFPVFKLRVTGSLYKTSGQTVAKL